MIKTIKEFFKGDKGLGRVAIIAIALMVIIGLTDFLFNKGNNLFTGWEILKNQSRSEWFWMFFASAIAGVIVILYRKFYLKTQDSKSILPFALAFMTFVSIAFGKACTDKANDGVTSEKGRPEKVQPVDDGRESAEDILNKNKK